MKIVPIVIAFPHGSQTGPKPASADEAFDTLVNHPDSIGAYIRAATSGDWDVRFVNHGWYDCVGGRRPSDFIPQVEGAYRPGQPIESNNFIFCPPMGGAMTGTGAARGSSQSGTFGGRMIGSGTWALDYSKPLTFTDNPTSIGVLCHEVMHSIASGTNLEPLAGWRDDNRGNITHEGKAIIDDMPSPELVLSPSGAVSRPPQIGPLKMYGKRGGPSSVHRVLMGLCNPFTDADVVTIGTDQLSGWSGYLVPLHGGGEGVRSLYIWDGVGGWLCLEYRRDLAVDRGIWNQGYRTGYDGDALMDLSGVLAWYYDGRDMRGPTGGSHGNRSGIMVDLTPGLSDFSFREWHESTLGPGGVIKWPGARIDIVSEAEGGIYVNAFADYDTADVFTVPGAVPPPPPPPPPVDDCQEHLDTIEELEADKQALVASESMMRTERDQALADLATVTAERDTVREIVDERGMMIRDLETSLAMRDQSIATLGQRIAELEADLIETERVGDERLAEMTAERDTLQRLADERDVRILDLETSLAAMTTSRDEWAASWQTASARIAELEARPQVDANAVSFKLGEIKHRTNLIESQARDSGGEINSLCDDIDDLVDPIAGGE
ncbi:MAG: hypothetical protein KJO36_06070 [Acidimicrobiia bacterium]|nr:hypothetical protein [Acidimicrobiia bacterium]